MGGSLLQLVATGHADLILTGEPQITMYKTVYRRCTNFAIEDCSKPMKGTGKFGGIYEAVVDRDGDLLGDQSIELDIDPLEMKWAAIANYQVDNRLAEIDIDGRPSEPEYAQLATWFSKTSQSIGKNALQYQKVAAAINALNGSLPEDPDASMNAVLDSISSVSATDTVLGSILRVLAYEMRDYWTPANIVQLPLDLVNLTGALKETTLRLTDGIELRNSLNTHLRNKIVQGAGSEIDLIDIIHNYTKLSYPIDKDYGSSSLVNVMNDSLIISSEFEHLDTYKAYRFIINNSATVGTAVTVAQLQYVFARLANEIPKILLYNGCVVMNTLTTINEIYGNIVYVKRIYEDDNFREFNTGQGLWKNFSSAKLREFILSDYYLKLQGLSKTARYTINGDGTANDLTVEVNLDNSSSYAYMLKNAFQTYIVNQLNAMISATSTVYESAFEELLGLFTDPWISGSSPDMHPLCIPYLRTKFNLTVTSKASNIDYNDEDVLYFDAILYYISERFYKICYDISDTYSGITYFDKDRFHIAISAIRVTMIDTITSYIFPLLFSDLAAAANANIINGQTAASAESPNIVHTFFKRQFITAETIKKFWNEALYDILSNLTGAYGAASQSLMTRVILKSISDITNVTEQYVRETPVLSQSASTSSRPIVSSGIELQYNSSLPLFTYPEMSFDDLTVVQNQSESSAIVDVSSNIVESPVQKYASLDNLAVYWQTLNRLQSTNYLDLYSNIILNKTAIAQQAGTFSGRLMGIFANDTVDKIRDLLRQLLLADQTQTKLTIKNAIGKVGIEVNLTTDNLEYYTVNRDLLNAVLSFYPSNSLTFDTIDSIAESYLPVMNQAVVTNLAERAVLEARLAALIPDIAFWEANLNNPSYPTASAVLQLRYDEQTLKNRLLAKNILFTTDTITQFFDFAKASCYSVGELYNIISTTLNQQISPWKLDNNTVQHLNTFLNSISPAQLLLETPDDLSTTLDYLTYALNRVPDGITSPRPNFPILMDIYKMAEIMQLRASDLNKTIIGLDKLAIGMENSANNSSSYAWIKRLGHFIFEWIEVTIGGETWDRHTGDYLDIWHELTGSSAHDRGYSQLIGDDVTLYRPSPNAKPRLRLTIPLRFWYCRNHGWFYPLIASQYSQMVVRCKLRDFSACIRAPQGSYPVLRDRIGRIVEATPSVRLRLQSKYVYLDRDERIWMAGHRHEYLYEYVQQHDTVVLDSKTYDFDTNSFKLRTYFQNPCKAIIVQTRMRSMETANEWTAGGWKVETYYPGSSQILSDQLSFTEDGALQRINSNPVLASNQLQLYTSAPIISADSPDLLDNSLTRGLIIENMSIIFNGITRQQAESGIYYANASTLRGWKRSPRDGIYSWNIGLTPSANYPTGVANMSRIDDVTLEITLDKGLRSLLDAGDAVTIRVFALTYGVMRCMSGMAGRAFQH